jgi:nitrate reductase delta subunit
MWTFDRSPSHSLHLFEHIHGESRDRGQAMVDLMEEYKPPWPAVVGDELPDYVPLFLEFLSLLDEAEGERLLGDAIHVLATSAASCAPMAARMPRVRPADADPCGRRAERTAGARHGRSAGNLRPRRRWRRAAAETAHGGSHPVNFYPKAAAPQRH